MLNWDEEWRGGGDRKENEKKRSKHDRTENAKVRKVDFLAAGEACMAIF